MCLGMIDMLQLIVFVVQRNSTVYILFLIHIHRRVNVYFCLSVEYVFVVVGMNVFVPQNQKQKYPFPNRWFNLMPTLLCCILILTFFLHLCTHSLINMHKHARCLFKLYH
jgi:hypothetical protein